MRIIGIIDIANSENSNFRIKYLGEYEFIFEIVLTGESKDQVGLSDEKKLRSKSPDTVPLRGEYNFRKLNTVDQSINHLVLTKIKRVEGATKKRNLLSRRDYGCKDPKVYKKKGFSSPKNY